MILPSQDRPPMKTSPVMKPRTGAQKQYGSGYPRAAHGPTGWCYDGLPNREGSGTHVSIDPTGSNAIYRNAYDASSVESPLTMLMRAPGSRVAVTKRLALLAAGGTDQHNVSC
jgi:hypothetical protein